MKIIYYYQTLVGLKSILDEETPTCTHIILSSIHFGKNKDNSPYIHLNDHSPDDSTFDECWKELKTLSDRGVVGMVMMGGAGGAYGDLFSNYDTYYGLLKNMISKHSDVIKGIDIDIEEGVELNDVKKLIQNIHDDFGEDFIITMAPLGGSLKYDSPGMGGFVYKDLYNSEVGKYINWFNGQYYGSYTIYDFMKTVQNGYPAEKIVMGMVSGNFPTKSSFDVALETIKHIKEKYPDFGGVDVWEYFDSPPGDKSDPGEWSKEMSEM